MLFTLVWFDHPEKEGSQHWSEFDAINAAPIFHEVFQFVEESGDGMFICRVDYQTGKRLNPILLPKQASRKLHIERVGT